MKIGIIGAGSMGQILARHLARLGHHVSIANSRGPESLTAFAAEIGATTVSVVDAVKAAEIVTPRDPNEGRSQIRSLPRRSLGEGGSGAPSPKPIELGSPNTAPNRKLGSGIQWSQNLRDDARIASLTRHRRFEKEMITGTGLPRF